MKRMSLCLFLLLALLAVPTAVLADSVSKHFADDDGTCAPVKNVPETAPPAGAAGNEDIKIKWKSKTSGGNSPLAANQGLTGCQSGASNAAIATQRLCEDCVAQTGSVLINPIPGVCGVPATPACTCANSTPLVAFQFFCTSPTAGSISVNKPADVSFTVSDSVDSQLMFVTHKTDAGNTVGTDLLPDITIRIDRFSVPMGTTSSVRVNIVSSTPPTTDAFTIDSTNLTDVQILNAMNTQFTSRGFANKIQSQKDLLANIPDYASFTGPAITVNPKSSTIRVEVKATRGMLNVLSNSKSTTGVPSLAAWGAALLIGVILLFGSWMLRRRVGVQMA